MTTTNIAAEAEAAAVARIVKEHVNPSTISISRGGLSTSVLLVPKGFDVISMKKHLDEVREAPERREGTASFVELESFIAHANRFKDHDSALFANPNDGAPLLTSVLDYHRANTAIALPGGEPADAALVVGGDVGKVSGSHEPRPSTEIVAGAPRFGRHRGLYAFPLSEEWEAWMEKDDQWMSQSDFAEFLERRIVDIGDPEAAFASAKELQDALGGVPFASPSKLLTLAKGIFVHVNSRVTNKVDRATGETQMMFETTHADEANQPLIIPRAFMIKVPVFRMGSVYRLAVRLLYRVHNATVTWSYKVHAAERALDEAFHEACQLAQERTSLPLFYGSPEGSP